MKEIKKIAKNCGRVERPADGSFDKFSVECNYFKHFLVHPTNRVIKFA